MRIGMFPAKPPFLSSSSAGKLQLSPVIYPNKFISFSFELKQYANACLGFSWG